MEALWDIWGCHNDKAVWRWRQGLTAPSTHPQVELSVLVARLDPEGVDGIGVDGGGLDLEDVGGHGPVGADAHVLVHHRVGQLPANGVGHRAHAAAATRTGVKAHEKTFKYNFLVHPVMSSLEDEPKNTRFDFSLTSPR